MSTNLTAEEGLGHVEALVETPVGPAMPASGEPEPGAGLVCAAMTRRGTPCGKTVGIAMTDLGPRCHTHRPRLASRLPPVTDIRTPEDARRLASWAALQVAAGQLSAQQGNAIVLACKEWRRAYELDTRMAERFKALEETIAILTAKQDEDERRRRHTLPEAE